MINEVIETLKAYTDGKDNAGKVEISVMQLNRIIKALEQQPTDAISRQAVLEAFGLSEKSRKYGGDHSGYDTLMKYEIQGILEDLPSVTAQRKMGHWEEIDIKGQRVNCCSVCGLSNGTIYPYNYCPNCGAKMQEVEK